MSATQEFLIDALVTSTAVPSRKLGRNDEAVVFFLLLIFCRLVAVETIHALFGVAAHFVFVNNRILLT